MRYGKSMVYLFTILFAAVAAFFWILEPEPAEAPPVTVTVVSQDKEEVIDCWKNEAGEYYIFLPGYAELSQVRLRANRDPVSINSQPVTGEIACDDFQLDTIYDLSFTVQGTETHAPLTFVRSGNLPAMYIDVGSGSMEFIHSQKGNEEAGRIRLYSAEGRLEHIGNLDSISGRGNTWVIPKKSYGLQLAAEADLLGMGAASKWILLSNAFDPSHVRNKLIYDFADAAGLAYSPQSQWVDLYLNGEYAGLYLLCERNEIHSQRVALEGSDSYLVSIDLDWRLEEQGYPFITTEAGYALRIHDTALHSDVLAGLWQSVENAILAEDGVDPLTGKSWQELLDLDSWVIKFLVEEIFGNGDAGGASQYFYGDGNGKVYAGPVWDYDVSMGNRLAWRVTEPEAYFANRSLFRSGVDVSWFHALYKNEVFYSRLTQLYRDTLQPLVTEFLNENLGQYAEKVAAASAMNQIRWTAIEAYAVDASTETENIRSYMAERMAFLNSIWLEKEEYCTVVIDSNDGSGTVCYAVRPGGYVPALPNYAPAADILGWYIRDTDEPFDMTQPVYEDMVIYLKRTSQESVEGESGDMEGSEESSRIPMKYAPFAVLLGILAVAYCIDKMRAKRMDIRKDEKTKIR